LVPDIHEIQVGPPVVFYTGSNTNEYDITELTKDTLVVAYNKPDVGTGQGALRFGYRPPHSDKIHFYEETVFSPDEPIQYPQLIR
jgi:hypothetical protein